MAEGSHSSGSPETRISSSSPEKPKKRVGKKEAKGFYYYASEYQRQAQKERKGLARLVSGVAEPFMIHIRAARLWNEARRKGGGKSAVLSSEFTKKALEGTLSKANIQEFKAKSQVHEVFNKSHISDEHAARAKSVLTDIFNNKRDQQITSEEMSKYIAESGLTGDEILKLQKIAHENGEGYLTVGEMKDRFADEAIYGSLTEDQQKLARQLRKDVMIATVLNVGKFGILGLIAANPAGWVGVAATTAISGFARIATLHKEGATYDISKEKGLDVAQGNKNLLGKIFSVDWEKDKKTRVWQVLRAAGVGAALGIGAKFIGPHLIDIWQHPGEAVQTGLTDAHNLGDSARHLGDNFRGGGGGMSSHDLGSQVVDAKTGLGSVNEHLSSFQTDKVHVSFLPDTKDHDWQQLHTFVDHQKLPDGKIVNEIKLSYNGVDDGIAHSQHYIDLMLNNKAGGEHVFIQNDAVLAVNGPDSEKLVEVFKFANGHAEHAGWMQSGNLATQMGLTQHSIDNFAKVTDYANQHWHGTQNASDLQRILFDRFGVKPNADGFPTDTRGFYAMRIGGGHFDSHGNFLVGASNHYYDHSLANNNVITHYNPAPALPGDTDEHFRSAWAPGLRTVDDWEDMRLEWLREHILPSGVTDRVVSGLDNLTDFELQNIDFVISQFQQDKGLFVLEALPFVATGAFFARTAPSKLKKVAAGSLTAVFPGFAALTGIGYMLGKIRGRKKKEDAHAPAKASSETAPSGQTSSPSNTTPATSPIAGAPMTQPATPSSQIGDTAAAAAAGAAAGIAADEAINAAAQKGNANPVSPAPVPPAANPSEQTESTSPTAGAPMTKPATPSGTTPAATPETVDSASPITNGGVTPPPSAPAAPPIGAVPNESVPETIASTVPIDVSDIDLPTISNAVAGTELADKAPFDVLKSEGSVEEKDKALKEGIQRDGPQKLLDTLLTPVATKLGLSQEELQQRVQAFLQKSEQLEKAGAFVVVAVRLAQIAANPDELKPILTKIAAIAKSSESREAVTQAVKNVLAEGGKAGEELAALGEDALPIIEDVAPLLEVV